MKTYLPERPVNAAVISPLFDHVIVAGAVPSLPHPPPPLNPARRAAAPASPLDPSSQPPGGAATPQVARTPCP